MAYSARLAERIRALLVRRKGFVEKKMFGGIGFLLNGNMCFGIWNDWLIVRLGSAQVDRALAQPFVKEFDITGRTMKGWAMVAAEGLEDEESLREWIQRTSRFVAKLPPRP